MGSFSGLLGLDIKDLEFNIGEPDFKPAEKELLFFDPNDQDRTYGVIYFGSKKKIAQTAGEDAEELQAVVRGLTVPRGKKVAYWSSIEVADSERGRGFGSRLVRHIIGLLHAEGVHCIVLQAQDSSGFWHRVGFSNSGEVVGWMDPVMVRCGDLDTP